MDGAVTKLPDGGSREYIEMRDYHDTHHHRDSRP